MVLVVSKRFARRDLNCAVKWEKAFEVVQRQVALIVAFSTPAASAAKVVTATILTTTSDVCK
jgi:hypothetical protein